MLCQMTRGGLAKVRVDMLSDRPHAMTNYQLQGDRGAYESARAHGIRTADGTAGEVNKVWLRDVHGEPNQWHDLAALEEEYMPEMWRDPPEAALHAGHGGGDYFEVLDFVRSITEGTPCPIGIHAAMDMTLPGLISQASVQAGGAWMEVPDSRAW